MHGHSDPTVKMPREAFTPRAVSGVIHQYTPKLSAFEYAPPATATNILLFISGLTEGLLQPTYPQKLAASLPPTWSIAQVILSSSYSGWGSSSLAKDASELHRCTSYFRSIKSGKVVLMGHSTGCQDVMEYLIGTGHAERCKIDGGILQAPVSDREIIVELLDPDLYESSIATARAMVADGRGEDMLPAASNGGFFGDACSARRWLSLAAVGGDDDYFSSDLSDARIRETFGRVPKASPLCILMSGSDEYVPAKVDKEALAMKWQLSVMMNGGDVWMGGNGIIEGASHNYAGCDDAVVMDMVDKVLGFLKYVEKKGAPKLS